MPTPIRIRASLSSVILDPQWGLARKRPRPESKRPPDYDEKFDFHTLCYDVFLDERTGLINLVCPRLYNLERVLREARIEADGHPVGIHRIQRHRRTDVVSLLGSPAPALLSIAGRRWEVSVPIQSRETAAFEGKNCLLTLSKNNDLIWIQDWARYHVKEHGAQAVLFFDNGSTAYGPEDIEASLAAVEGLEVLAVVSAPFPHGALGRRSFWEPPSKFLQAGILNLGHWRFLAAARAVLSVDIDELVWSADGSSIFDEAAASPLGYVTISGSWVFPAADRVGPYRHRHHSFFDPRGREQREKWCVVPDGALESHIWDVHRVRGVWKKHLTRSTRCRYWHFSHVSTDWKENRPKTPKGRRTPDPRLAAAMSRIFPASPAG
jgi:hypothetical protein